MIRYECMQIRCARITRIFCVNLVITTQARTQFTQWASYKEELGAVFTTAEFADMDKPDIDLANYESSHSNDSSSRSQPADLEAARVESNLQHFIEDNIDDPNIDHNILEKANEVLEDGDKKAEILLNDDLKDESPYAEVRAAVSDFDPEMPVNTIRAWLLGLIAVIVPPGVNQLLSLRFPSTTISAYVIIIFVYPLGKLCEKVLPTAALKTPFGNFTLNPGPFNVKEHSLISIMSLMSYQSAYATMIPAVQRFVYSENPSIGYSLLLTLSTQLLGLSFACIMRRFLVYPASMIYPVNLPKTTLLNSLHGRDTSAGTHKGMSRFKFFWLCFTGLVCWQFFPGYIFTLLSQGNWFCLIFPENVPLNQVFGSSSLGLLPLTLDWQTISYSQDPLASPWWAEANMLGGFALFFLVVVPALYYSNVWNQKYLPMFSSQTFDRFGKKYDVRNVTTPRDGGGFVFNPDGYNRYLEQYIPTSLAMSYFLSFAATTGVIVHVALFHGKAIWRQFRTPIHSEMDVHTRLMTRYKETPYWCFALLFAISFGMGIAATYNWYTGLPAWAFVIAILVGAVFLLPIGVVMALSNQEVGLNMISELIVGYMLPGRPIAMMIFKTTMYMICYQGLQFVTDQKLGHYMKIPPRTVFAAQVFATVVGGIVQILVQEWAFANIENVCTPAAKESNKFTCDGIYVFGTASKVWGLIGPRAMFDAGRQYNHILFGFVVGAGAPVIIWLLSKRFPKSFWRLINLPIIFTATGSIPPATGMMYTSAAFWGFLFQFVIKRRRPVWWTKYNYILSAALNGGTTIATVVIFFALQFPIGPNRDFYSSGWWGNTAWQNTADAMQTPFWNAPKDGFEGTPAQLGRPI